MSEMVFVLPLPVNLGNARLHWAMKDKRRKAYWAALDARVTLRRLPYPPVKPWPRASLDAELHHTHATDADNREARLKYAVDWLVSRGYIVDDGDAHLERTGLCRAVMVRKLDDRKLVLRLTPLEAA